MTEHKKANGGSRTSVLLPVVVTQSTLSLSLEKEEDGFLFSLQLECMESKKQQQTCLDVESRAVSAV